MEIIPNCFIYNDTRPILWEQSNVLQVCFQSILHTFETDEFTFNYNIHEHMLTINLQADILKVVDGLQRKLIKKNIINSLNQQTAIILNRFTKDFNSNEQIQTISGLLLYYPSFVPFVEFVGILEIFADKFKNLQIHVLLNVKPYNFMIIN